MSIRVGEHIGPYQLLEKIGEGGMGTVFKAYHPALDRHVALKIIHSAYREDQAFIARFQREARLVARLEHANIVPIYDYAEYEKLSYLVIKFIEGSTLKDRLAKGPLGFYEILQVVDSVGSALAYAHNQGVLHRDIKPSNVLIGANGVIYLADFGLARVAQAEASTLSSESVMGTPHYISPEQAMGRDDLDKRTDIYSFGVMLYEIFVGQAPFDAKAAYAIIHDHIYTPLPLPRTLNPNVPETVERVLLKALAKDPNARFEDVSQMVLAFKDAYLNTNSSMSPAAATFLPVAPNPGSKEVKQSEPRKKKRMGWLYILASLVIFIGVAFYLLPNFRSNLLSALTSTNTPTLSLSFELTSTSQVTNNGMTSAPVVQGTNGESTPIPDSTPIVQRTNSNTTPVPQSTNTPAPTTRPTQTAQNILTSPPVIPTIETVINQIIATPSLLPPLQP